MPAKKKYHAQVAVPLTIQQKMSLESVAVANETTLSAIVRLAVVRFLNELDEQAMEIADIIQPENDKQS